MNPTRPALRLPRRWLAALVIAHGFALSFAPAQDGGCEPPEQPSAPAAGDYQGYFRLICEMHFPASPPLVVPMKYEGDLSFSLGRPDLDDPRSPAPPPPEKRRPLRPPAARQPAPAPDPAAVEAVSQAAVDEAALAAVLARADASHQGLYVPPGGNARIEGESNVSIDGSFKMATGNGQIQGKVDTKRTIPFEVRGEEDPLTATFKELTLWGYEDQAAFRGDFNAVMPGGRAWGNVDFNDTGATGRAVGESESGRVERDFSITTRPGAPPREDKYQRARREFDEAYDRLFGQPKQKLKVVTLTVTATDCWLLRGTVASEELAENLKKWGARLVVKESEWMATLDEREPEFEKRVQALAADPLPTPITWAYIDSFTERWQALRREADSSYKRCVIKELHRKYLAIQVAGMRELVNNLPRARDGANCRIMRAAFERILPLMRLLQLSGLGDCSVIAEFWKQAGAEVQEMIKQLLARKHTPSELACFLGVAAYVDLGEQTTPFWDAWHQVEAAAAASR